jgi:S-methylmethionine-dependent homocysteine/selenocysteine methylase
MADIKILDGGMGRELKRIGAPFQQPQWSALALMQSPEHVTQAHQNFIDAGSCVITTNAYALVPFHIGLEEFYEQAYDLARLSAKIAKDVAGDSVSIAGCIPPAFGSYQPDAFKADLVDEILTPLITAQDDHIDHWIVETTPSLSEAQAVLAVIKSHSDKPIWMSFTLNNREDLTQPCTLRSGEPISDIAPIIDHVDAVLFNCSQPEEMTDAIKITRGLNADIAIGAYANNFSEIKRTKKANEGISQAREDITPEIYLEFAKSWVDAGATLIGGCCGIAPNHIRVLSDYFKN